jgi:cell wall-associated NlpC family hydrolase
VREAAPGDVLVFRMRDGGVAKHAGILVSASSFRRTPVSSLELVALDSGLRRNDDQVSHMIHAQEGLGVVEIPLGRWWLRRAVVAFRFPSL